eukprot:TRINITY_DN18405_c0_g1_i1.p1 TRINITY_DN18405_c0_g1~~TRINITY_DN18405_c0_g1_i1.p1  ORF type:complete len:547 (+),score=236.85 TRINITY_DN18405_c0_g1_i1:114-1754(+)
MEYTRQQLCGYKDFGAATRTGNWREDIAREGDAMRDYLVKRGEGKLVTQQVQRKMKAALHEVTLTPQHADEYLRFGDTIMLQSAATQGCLSVDTNSEVPGRPANYVVSVGNGKIPVVRATWSLQKAKDTNMKFYNGKGEGDVVHYGQQVRVVNRMAFECNLNLSADIATPAKCLKGTETGRQRSEVTAEVAGALETVWTITPSDIKWSAEMKGAPVKTGDIVALSSVKANQFLSVEGTKLTSFGKEAEVSTFFHKDQYGKNEARTIGAKNLWGVVCAPKGARFVPHEPHRNQDVLEKVRQKIIERASGGGADGLTFKGLLRSFKIMDDDGNRKLSRRELKEGMATYRVHMAPVELDAVFEEFDRDGDGVVSITEFLRAVRGPMNARRLALTRECFKRIDTDGSGVASFAELKAIYGENLPRHPEVLSGKKTEDEVMREFLLNWDRSRDGNVEIGEFIDYYTDLSVNVDDDDYFELMMRNAWHVSGGEGVCENTSNRRVLVEYEDGRPSTVEEIKDDLGIGPNDIDLMMMNLEKQGITGIKCIRLYQ